MQLDKSVLVALKGQIDEIDEKLDAAAGSQTAGRRALTNSLIKDNQETVDKLASQMTEVFNRMRTEKPVEFFVGVYSGVLREVAKSFDDTVKEYLDSQVEKVKENTPSFTEEELKGLSEDRKDLAKKWRGIREILEMMEEDLEGVEEPKRRTGSHGKRGPRKISLFTWSVDGVRQAAEVDTLAGVAASNGYENAKELRDALNTAGVDTKNPPDQISFSLKNGKTLTGVKKAVDTEDDTEEDEDEDEDSEESDSE